MLFKDMQVHQKGVITKVHASSEVARRLYEMGFLPGTEFEVMHAAPLKYPLTIKIRGYQIILSKKDASALEVEKL